MLVYILRTMKLVFTIMCICYFMGILWFIYADRINDHLDGPSDDGFIKKFKIYDKHPLVSSLVMMYYFFTTLSTIGFGDYYPVSDLERLANIPIFLFGVMVFSFIMGNFSDIL